MAQEQKPASPPTVAFTVKAGHASQPSALEVHAAEGDLKPWDLDTRLRVVKGRHPRLEGPLKVTGKAKYTFDVALPGMLWGKMVRASLPAAEILSIDTSKAEALPGVKAVWATESRKVRFAGQDVAAVAAVSPEVAEDAARLVIVKYDAKPFVTDLKRAMEEDAPRRGNVIGPKAQRPGTERGDVLKGLAEATASVEATYLVPTHTRPSRPTASSRGGTATS